MTSKKIEINKEMKRFETDSRDSSIVIKEIIDWLRNKNEQLKKRGIQNLWRWEAYYDGKRVFTAPFHGLIAKRKVWHKNDKDKWDCDNIEIKVMDNSPRKVGRFEMHRIITLYQSQSKDGYWSTYDWTNNIYTGSLEEIERQIDEEEKELEKSYYHKKGQIKTGGVITDNFGKKLVVVYTEPTITKYRSKLRTIYKDADKTNPVIK